MRVLPGSAGLAFIGRSRARETYIMEEPGRTRHEKSLTLAMISSLAGEKANKTGGPSAPLPGARGVS